VTRADAATRAGAATRDDAAAPASRWFRDALVGFAAGAALGLLAHVAALVASAEGAPHDEASRRVSVELQRIATDTTRFAVAVAAVVALASGVIGWITAWLVRWAAPRRRRGFAAATIALTALALAAVIVRAFLAQPALLEPSLGGARGRLAPALAQLASHATPRTVDVALAALALALVAAGALRRRVLAAARRALAHRAVRRRALALAGVALVAVLLAAVPRSPRAPALLVLGADSLRPDRMDARTAPALTAFAARGLSFDRALTPLARTTPAWISILTGLYPHSHGVRHMFPRRELRPASLDYLPRRLARAGYLTVLVTDYAGDFFPLFDAGFERVRVPPTLTLPLVFQREVVSRSPLALALLNDRLGRELFPVMRYLMTNSDPRRLADEALDELERGDGRPTALFVFFSTTHVPFAAPAPYYRRFASPTYGGTHRYAYDVQRLADVTASDAALPDADVAQIRALYDGTLTAVDDAAARLLARTDARSTVVLLADHGENLFEPGTTTHHGKWFVGGDETLRVPLAFVGPGLPARRVPEPVSLVDVAPTIAELLRLHVPAAPADGRSLAAAGAGTLAPADVFAETGEWLNGPATPDGVRYPPLTELLEADARDRFQLVLKARYEDAVVEAKHRLLRRGERELLYVPTAAGVRWELRGPAADDATRADLQRALLRFLERDRERELDARDHLIRRVD
jgi:arylsulfatase A-like enzyme